MARLTKQFPSVITSSYGTRNGSTHSGVDIVGNNGSCNVLDYICAKEKGKVVAVRKNCTGFEAGGSYGNYVKIDHGSGIETLYAHLAYNSVCVNVGDTVDEGQVIGYMGNTGTSYGGHLHFEVRRNGKHIDPTDYMWGTALPLNVIESVKSVEEIVKEVIAGNWGNGQDRIDRLTNAGYNYSVVQARVNELMASVSAPQVDILDLTRRAIRGDFGNGQDRRNALGSNYNEIQRQIDLNYQNGTTNWDNIRLY